MADKRIQERRAAERRLFETEVTFQPESDINKARSVDISEGGIRVVSEKPMEIRIQIHEGDILVQYDAQLVWAQMKEDGTMEYGLKY
jgi:c-di-GMP-binding flagellar brake protein YcgR